MENAQASPDEAHIDKSVSVCRPSSLYLTTQGHNYFI